MQTSYYICEKYKAKWHRILQEHVLTLVGLAMSITWVRGGVEKIGLNGASSVQDGAWSLTFIIWKQTCR